MTATVVDRLHAEFVDLVNYLNAETQPSLVSTADGTFRKSLLMAAASHCEFEICSILQEFAEKTSRGNKAMVNFVRNKAIQRQYHTLFAWDRRNANTFFGLFGEEFSTKAKEEVGTNQELSTSIASFLELGEERNRLAHQNFGNYTLEKTSQEIFDTFQSAKRFLAWCKERLLGDFDDIPDSGKGS